MERLENLEDYVDRIGEDLNELVNDVIRLREDVIKLITEVQILKNISQPSGLVFKEIESLKKRVLELENQIEKEK